MENAIVDLYDGEVLTVWKDEEQIFLSFPWCTINIPIEDFDVLVEDLKEFIWGLKENKNNGFHGQDDLNLE